MALLLAVPSVASATGKDIDNNAPDDSVATEPERSQAPRDVDRTVVVPENLSVPENLTRNGRFTTRWPSCWHIIGCDSNERADADTAYMSCQSSWIDSVALSYNIFGTSYAAIHIDYNWRARLGFGGGLGSLTIANAMYNGMLDCLDDHNFDPYVQNWDAIWQQLHCHVVYQIDGGATWDLEGHRQSNWVGYLSPLNRCQQ